VCVAVGEEATVRQDAATDHRAGVLARSLALDPPGQELGGDDARVVEGDDDGRVDRPCAPQRLNEVGPLVGGIWVFRRFVGVAVPEVIEEEAVGVASLGEFRIHLCPAEDLSGQPGRNVSVVPRPAACRTNTRSGERSSKLARWGS
jgi:hypothetical protein